MASSSEPGRLHLHQCVAQFRGELLPGTTECLGQHFGDRFLAAASAKLTGHLKDYLPRIEQKLAELEAEHKYLENVATPLRDLAELTGGTRQELKTLGERFVHDVVVQPAPKDVVLEPRAAKPRTSKQPGSKPASKDKRPGSVRS